MRECERGSEGASQGVEIEGVPDVLLTPKEGNQEYMRRGREGEMERVCGARGARGHACVWGRAHGVFVLAYLSHECNPVEMLAGRSSPSSTRKRTKKGKIIYGTAYNAKEAHAE